MGKIKKIFAAVFGVFTLTAVCAAAAYAENLTVGQNDDFQQIVTNAAENDTIKLTGNIENISSQISITKPLTIDLNGYTLSGEVTGATSGLIYVNAGTADQPVKIVDNSSGEKGLIKNESKTATVNVIYVNTSANLELNGVKVKGNSTGGNCRGIYVNSGTVHINRGSINVTSSKTVYAIALYYGTTATINNVDITANSTGGVATALFPYPSSKQGLYPHITVTGGTVTAIANSAATGISLNNNVGVTDTISDVTVNATSNVSAATAIKMSSKGDATISGSTLNATIKKDGTNKAIGIDVTGGGIQCNKNTITVKYEPENYVAENSATVVPVSSTSKTVQITDGTYNAVNAANVTMKNVSIINGDFNYEPKSETPETPNITMDNGCISGGTFNFPIKTEWCAAGFSPTEVNGEYTVTGATAETAVISVQTGENISYGSDIDWAIQNSFSNSIITVLKDIETANAITLTNGAQLNIAEGATLTCGDIELGNETNNAETNPSGTNNGTIISSGRVTLTGYNNEGIITSNTETLTDSFIGCINSGTITVNFTANLTNCKNTATGIIKDAKGITIRVVSVENDGTIEGVIREGTLNDKPHTFISTLDVCAEMTGSNGLEGELYTWSGEGWVKSPNAENTAAKIIRNGKYYASYRDVSIAISNISSGDTVKFMADTADNESYSILPEEDVVLDLNGHTIKIGKSNQISVASGKQLTIMDSTATGTPSIDASGNVTGYTAGKITTAYKNYLIEVPNNSKLIVNSGIIELTTPLSSSIMAPIMIADSVTGDEAIVGASNASVEINGGAVTSTGYGIAVYGAGEGTTPSTITVNNGAVESHYPALLGNGNYHNTVMNVNGGELYSDDVAIYQPQTGTLNITDGKITGKTGVEIRSGELNITGGEIITNATELTPTANPNGTSVLGAAVAVSQHSTDRAIDVKISGGTFKANTGANAFYEKDLMNPGTGAINMSITGGDFTGTVESKDVPKFISGGTFTADVQGYMTANAVEQVGDSIFTVYPSKNDVIAGVYKSAYAEGAETYKHVTGNLTKALETGDTSVQFNVTVDDNQPYSVKGILPEGTTINGTASFAFEVTEVPIGTNVSVTID